MENRILNSGGLTEEGEIWKKDDATKEIG